MYICECIYICIYIHIYVYMYIFKHTHTLKYARTPHHAEPYYHSQVHASKCAGPPRPPVRAHHSHSWLLRQQRARRVRPAL